MERQNPNIILETKQLAIGYKSRAGAAFIASGISIKLEKGQLIGLVGANGIGKSTLLRTLIKVQPPLEGEILLNGHSLSDLSAAALAQQLSIVLTEQLISKNLSVYDLVALGRYPYTNWIGTLQPNDRAIIDNAIEMVRISDLRHRKCYELSDGQLQKVMIARALAQDTDIIILDEPTTHLDMYHKAYILKLLQRLTKETNKTILFSSHEIDLAIQLCDEMVVMRKTDVVQDQPCNLISKQIFDSLFPPDLISFDSRTGSFKVSK
jgi:iron complex transport system ATP-binding protein